MNPILAAVLLLTIVACAPRVFPCGPSDQPVSDACTACLGGGNLAACLDTALKVRVP